MSHSRVPNNGGNGSDTLGPLRENAECCRCCEGLLVFSRAGFGRDVASRGVAKLYRGSGEEGLLRR